MLGDVILTTQAIGETLKIVTTKADIHAPKAIAEIERWTGLFSIADTHASDMLAAARFAARHQLQFWDSVIWQVARRRRVKWFVSEDLQDGLIIDGMEVVNPFNPANLARLPIILAPNGPAFRPAP